MKVKTINNYDYKNTGTVFTEPSQTRQSDYEDVNSLVARIIRGEIRPVMPEEFEYSVEETDEILASEHPLDSEDLDISDFGSLYQDDVREGIDEVLNTNVQVIQQEQEQSGANTNSSSDVTEPVDNLQAQE